MYKADRWFVQDGEWFVSDKKYSIDKAHADRFAKQGVPEKGGAATHLIAKVPAGANVKIVNRYGNKIAKDFTSDGNWFDFPMDHGASYVPDRGETGPWDVYVNNQLVAGGVGLPDSVHASTWLEVTESTTGEPETPPENPPETPGEEGPEIPPGETEKDQVWVEVTVEKKIYAGWIPKWGYVNDD